LHGNRVVGASKLARDNVHNIEVGSAECSKQYSTSILHVERTSRSEQLIEVQIASGHGDVIRGGEGDIEVCNAAGVLEESRFEYTIDIRCAASEYNAGTVLYDRVRGKGIDTSREDNATSCTRTVSESTVVVPAATELNRTIQNSYKTRVIETGTNVEVVRSKWLVDNESAKVSNIRCISSAQEPVGRSGW